MPQLGRLREDQVVVAQGDAEAAEYLGHAGFHGFDLVLRELVGLQLSGVSPRYGLVHLQSVEGRPLEFVGGVELAAGTSVLQDPLLQLLGPDLGQAVVVDDQDPGHVPQGRGAAGKGRPIMGAHAVAPVALGGLEDLQRVPRRAVGVLVALPSQPLAVDPVAQQRELFQVGLAGCHHLFQAVLLQQTGDARMWGQVGEVVGTPRDLGLVQFHQFGAAQAGLIFLQVRFQGDALQHRGLVGRRGAQGGAKLHEAAGLLQGGPAFPGGPGARVEGRGRSRAHLELDPGALRGALPGREPDFPEL